MERSAAKDAPILSGKRERAPGKGVRGSDIPAHLSGTTLADGKRERAPARGVKVSDNPAHYMGKTLSDGKRGRAPAEGAMDSDIPTQQIDKMSRLGELQLALVMDKEVVKEHAQWSQPEMKEKIGTQTRMDPDASFMVDGGGPVLSGRIAEERNRILRQGLTESGEQGKGEGIGGMGSPSGVFAGAAGHSAQGFGGHASGAHLERG